jgi:hypothetical protein
VEVALNLVERTDGVAIRCRGTNYLAAPNTLQSQAAYQLHIPAHRDRPFRLNVTACSGLS